MCRLRGLERFSRTLIDGEKLYGTITITDGQSSQSIYNRSRDHYESISPGQIALLTGPARSISACDSFTMARGLPSQSLTRTLSPSIANLSNLQSVLLQNNAISGPIPAAIGKLEKLQTLYLSSNKFNGEIPSSLGDLKNLNYLKLNNNSLTGSIPDTLSKVEGLTLVWLWSLSGNFSGLRNFSGYLSMSMFWLAPQFIILEIGDGFTLVGLQEYFYDQIRVFESVIGFIAFFSLCVYLLDVYKVAHDAKAEKFAFISGIPITEIGISLDWRGRISPVWVREGEFLWVN
ncbi:unnamed protein product [Camellia sinensis]